MMRDVAALGDGVDEAHPEAVRVGALLDLGVEAVPDARPQDDPPIGSVDPQRGPSDMLQPSSALSHGSPVARGYALTAWRMSSGMSKLA